MKRPVPHPLGRAFQRREIDADRRAEWWLVLKSVIALAVVAGVLVAGGALLS